MVSAHYSQRSASNHMRRPTARQHHASNFDVQKPQRQRHRRKDEAKPHGRRAHLSSSQKRKLVRLYIYTNLSLDDIRSLIVPFGTKKIEKRALRYNLSDLLSKGYYDLRPQDSESRQRRRRHVQRCKCFAPSIPAESKAGLDDVFSRYTTLLEEPRSELQSQNYSYPSEVPQNTCDQNPLGLSLSSDLPFRSREQPQRELNAPTEGRYKGQEVGTLDSPLIRFKPAMTSPANSAFNSAGEDAFWSPTFVDGSLSYSSSTLTTPLGPSTPLNNPDFPPSSAEPCDLISKLEGNTETLYTNDTRFRAGNGVRTVMPVEQTEPEASDNGNKEAQLRSSRWSNVSSKINRLSKCSSDGKPFIKQLLRKCSSSTLSSISLSTRSRFSILSSTSARSASAHPSEPSTPEMSPESGDVRQCPARRGCPDDLEHSLRKAIDLPGDFILHHPNVLSKHFGCTGDSLAHSSPYLCEYCCPQLFVKVSGDVASTTRLIEFFECCKSGSQLQSSFSFKKYTSWTDIFGNTVLHVAAALGASYWTLATIVYYSPDVNRTNSGGQTFLHVLAPKGLSRHDDPYLLRKALWEKSFDFAQPDVRGRTYLDCFRSSSPAPVALIAFWLEPLISRDDIGGILNYAYIQQAFRNAGGTDMQWNEAGWNASQLQDTSLAQWQQYRFGSSTSIPSDVPQRLAKVQKLDIQWLIDMSRNVLIQLEDLVDGWGRNCLHIAAQASEKPAQPDVTPGHDNPSIRQTLVRRLLNLACNVNHHDKQGETPLMAHIRSTPREPESIEMLLKGGAHTDLRNIRGETALHIATKIGYTAATRHLLEYGANVHVRNSRGEGVLSVVEATLPAAKREDRVYAGINGCMGLAIDAGAVASPDLVQEWSLPQHREAC